MKLLTECPICLNQSLSPYSMRFESKFPHISRTICDSSEIVFANPVSEPQELDVFYANYYEKGNFAALGYKEKMLTAFNEIEQMKLDQLDKYDKNLPFYKNEGNYLDVGFGLGLNLYVAKKLGFAVFGTELDRDCIDYASKHITNASLFHGDLIHANYPNNHFDIINICHVIEHLINPMSYIKKLKRILNVEGIVIVSTPNIEAFAYKAFRVFNFFQLKIPLIVDGLEHTVLFNKRNLKLSFEQNGFKIITHFTESVDDTWSNIWKSKLSFKKKILRFVQTKVHINQVMIAMKS